MKGFSFSFLPVQQRKMYLFKLLKSDCVSVHYNFLYLLICKQINRKQLTFEIDFQEQQKNYVTQTDAEQKLTDERLVRIWQEGKKYHTQSKWTFLWEHN